MRQRVAQKAVTATGVSSILKASRKLSCLHGMQGVRSSSLLGSILQSPVSGWAFLCLRSVAQRCDFAGWCDFWCDLHTTAGGVHDLPPSAGASRFVLGTPVDWCRPTGRPGCDQSHHGSRSSSTYWEQLLWANPIQKKGEHTSTPRSRRRPEISFNTLSGSTFGCWNGSLTIPLRPTISIGSLMVTLCFAKLSGRLALLV